VGIPQIINKRLKVRLIILRVILVESITINHPMKKKKEETVKHIKKVYVAPQVTSIPVDHEISLMMSENTFG
jgi:hypothetical protein